MFTQLDGQASLKAPIGLGTKSNSAARVGLKSKINGKANGAESLLLEMLTGIEIGTIHYRSSQANRTFQGATSPEIQADIQVLDDRFFEDVMSRGDIGLAEAYIRGYFRSDNLSELIQIGVLNKAVFGRAISGQWWRLLYYQARHLLSRNTKSGSRSNIRAHYDLGNDFYKKWLDTSMSYSSAYWGQQSNLTLVGAQENKYRSILNSLGAKVGDHILEIGCGWGGFLEYAAGQGMRVTGVTISQEQYSFAQERIKHLGFENVIKVEFCDYRDLKGQYDHCVSIEMMEAVGAEYWSTYFTKIKELVRPGGAVCLQVITIDDEVFPAYKAGTDFIQQYIFPGGLLPCLREMKKLTASVGGKHTHLTSFGLDYARTLRFWSEAFEFNGVGYAQAHYGAEFVRMWRFYLAYCEGAFRSKQTDVIFWKFSL